MACNVVYLVLIVVNSRLTLRCGRTGLRLKRRINAGNRRPGGISCAKPFRRSRRGLILATVMWSLPGQAAAAEFDGSSLSILWALPFVGILLSIALFPLLAAHTWEHHQGKIAALWGLLVLIPMAMLVGPSTALQALLHTALLEYIPFILLLLALFTVAGGIVVRGNIHGAPVINTSLLALGAVLASLIGTTGASIVMIRPVMRANDNRRHNVHVVVFFIFLVSNIGGSLTPLGDPPLFLGFLRGVDFFWTTQNLWRETFFVSGVLLVLFFLLDWAIYRKEGVMRPDPTPDTGISVVGGINFPLLAIIIAAILMSAKLDLGRDDDPERRGRTREPAARRDHDRGRLGVARLDAEALSRRERFLVGTDRRSGEALCRYLPHHHPGSGHAAGGVGGRFRASGGVGDSIPTGAPITRRISGLPGGCRHFSIMRRPTWCSSSLPEAMPNS